MSNRHAGHGKAAQPVCIKMMCDFGLQYANSTGRFRCLRHSFQTLANHLALWRKENPRRRTFGKFAPSCHLDKCMGPGCPVLHIKSMYNWKCDTHTSPSAQSWRVCQNQLKRSLTIASPYHLVAPQGTHKGGSCLHARRGCGEHQTCGAVSQVSGVSLYTTSRLIANWTIWTWRFTHPMVSNACTCSLCKSQKEFGRVMLAFTACLSTSALCR